MVKYLDGRQVAETAVAKRGGIVSNERVLIALATSALVIVVACAVYWRMA